MRRFTVTIEGSNWEDVQELELLEAPRVGDAIETRYGTCLVTRAELLPDNDRYTGEIVCRFPVGPRPA